MLYMCVGTVLPWLEELCVGTVLSWLEELCVGTVDSISVESRSPLSTIQWRGEGGGSGPKERS